jgi:hypothetical protein
VDIRAYIGGRRSDGAEPGTINRELGPVGCHQLRADGVGLGHPEPCPGEATQRT